MNTKEVELEASHWPEGSKGIEVGRLGEAEVVMVLHNDYLIGTELKDNIEVMCATVEGNHSLDAYLSRFTAGLQLAEASERYELCAVIRDAVVLLKTMGVKGAMDYDEVKVTGNTLTL